MKERNLQIIEINGERYISARSLFKEKLFKTNFENINYIIKVKKEQKFTIDEYWERAANENMREKFMNTVRPLLKEKMGYEFSEIICEEKSKLLCEKYYELLDQGLKYEGPYLID